MRAPELPDFLSDTPSSMSMISTVKMAKKPKTVAGFAPKVVLAFNSMINLQYIMYVDNVPRLCFKHRV